MNRLIKISNEAIKSVPASFTRFLYGEIDWGSRLIGISGARGNGKTVLLLQHLKKVHSETDALYVSLDDVYFSENRLIHFAEDFYKHGGELLLLDEVHKYHNWSQELKNIYDSMPGLRVIFTSSSALEIYRGSHDLSRRAVIYNMPGMSLREFISLKYKKEFPVLTLEQILTSKYNVYEKIHDSIKVLKFFKEYLQTGYYPFFIDAKTNYLNQLLNTINLVVENDLPAIHNIDFNSVLKIKKLLSVLSRIVPYKPNIEKLARQVGTTRDTLLRYLYYLEKAQIIKWLGRDSLGINYLNKPDKLYLNNTNLAYALSNMAPDQGNLRETFFINQVMVKHNITYPSQSDFLVDDKYLFEVGGRRKTQKQIAGIKNSFIAIDDIEYGYKNQIPLWVFGFLY